MRRLLFNSGGHARFPFCDTLAGHALVCIRLNVVYMLI
jgi:hypothetical protein